MKHLRIDDLLKEKSLTGKEISEAVGISTTAMSALVTGKSQPRFELLSKIAVELNVDIRDLFHSTKETNLAPLYIRDEEGTYKKIGSIYKD